MIHRFPELAPVALLAILMQIPAQAATCSCAGVPLLTFLDTSAVEKGEVFLNYTAEYHQINDLVSGSDDVRDETGRNRETTSQVLSASYALTDHWAISALVSYVKHNRKIGLSSIGKTTSSGIGDSVILARYTPLFMTPFSRHEVSLGLGARMPTGEDDFRDTFLLSEDMQPSVGAWGTIAWTSYSYAFNQAATMQLNTSASYTLNEENRRKYMFGDELNVAVGFSHSPATKFGYSVSLRYRTTQADQRGGYTIPNTGGEWLDFVPAVQFAIGENLDFALSGRIPLARHLKGALQFTTSYSYAMSLTYGF